MEILSLTLKEGPVFIESLGSEGVNNKYALWDGIISEENFPKTNGSAYYILTLCKKVEKSGEVEEADRLLRDAVKLLAQVWQFAGGSRMSLERVESNRILSANLENNSDEVKEKLLAKEGIKELRSVGVGFQESCATYYRPPLKKAIELCLKAKKDENLKKLFEYHYETHLDSTNWFTPLYKIRDVLENIFGSDTNVKSSLGISSGQWSDFGRILNNYDLRHAPEQVNYFNAVSTPEIELVKRLGDIFVESYLKYLGYV